MKLLEEKFSTHPDKLIVATNLFASCDRTINRLIQQNHWKKFHDNISTLKYSSNCQ